DLLAARADDRARSQTARVVERAEHHPAADGQEVERRAHAGGGRLLRRMLVVPAEPARRDERRPLGRAQVRLAEAGPVGAALEGAGLAHRGPVRLCSAASSRRSATTRAALSASSFSITGTPAR